MNDKLREALETIAKLHIIGPMTSEQGHQLMLVTDIAEKALAASKKEPQLLQKSFDELAAELVAKAAAMLEAQLAEQASGREPVAWMREGWGPDCGPYVEFYRDDEMGWRDRKEWTPLYTHPQPQAEAVSPDKAKNFYLAVCNFLVWIGREGTVHADDSIIDQLSNALHDIDGGVFKDSLKWPQAEVRVPDGYVLVKLGFGKVEVASGNHEGVPALIFGKNGTGIIGEATQPNRMHAEGETLACVTFANAESLEVVQHHINEVRAMLAAAPKP